MKTSDIGNDIVITVKDRDESIVDLTLATSATLRWKIGTAVVAEKVMTFLAPRTAGQVIYKIIAADLALAGIYDMELKLIFSTGETLYSVNSIREKVDPVLA